MLRLALLALARCAAPAILTPAAGLSAANASGGAPAIADISVAELNTAIGAKSATAGLVIIDVNGTKSFEKAHLPGGIDYAAVSKDLAAALPADKSTPIVVYCGSSKCTAYAKAGHAAIALGYTNVKHLSVGLAGWKAPNLAVESAVTH